MFWSKEILMDYGLSWPTQCCPKIVWIILRPKSLLETPPIPGSSLLKRKFWVLKLPKMRLWKWVNTCVCKILKSSHSNRVIYSGVLSTGWVRLDLRYKDQNSPIDNSFRNISSFISTWNKKQFLQTMLAIQQGRKCPPRFWQNRRCRRAVARRCTALLHAHTVFGSHLHPWYMFGFLPRKYIYGKLYVKTAIANYFLSL